MLQRNLAYAGIPRALRPPPLEDEFSLGIPAEWAAIIACPEDFIDRNTPEVEAERREADKHIRAALARLRPRHADVLSRRFGIPPFEKEQTLDEVGAAYGVTRERIRQIESKALRSLRELAKTTALRECFDPSVIENYAQQRCLGEALTRQVTRQGLLTIRVGDWFNISAPGDPLASGTFRCLYLTAGGYHPLTGRYATCWLHFKHNGQIWQEDIKNVKKATI